jgi:ferric-dicitrate binding protein FerR (iron transport regulator)
MNKYKEILNQWESPDGKPTEQAWAEMQAKIARSEASPSPRVIRFSWKPMVSVAAAAALIIGLIVLWPNQMLRQVTAQAGVHEMVTLPDQSQVDLNAGSSISFTDPWEGDRQVKLDGQAFFEVVKGGKFSVVTSNGVVEVLGTSFDVFARNQRFAVECRTGKVKVTSNHQEVDIVPGYRAEVIDGQLTVSEFDMARGDWRMGEFNYEHAPLVDVFEELKRQFNVQITWPDVANRFYTGRFSNKNLEEALQLICVPMGLKFEMRDNATVLITEGRSSFR